MFSYFVTKTRGRSSDYDKTETTSIFHKNTEKIVQKNSHLAKRERSDFLQLVVVPWYNESRQGEKPKCSLLLSVVPFMIRRTRCSMTSGPFANF